MPEFRVGKQRARVTIDDTFLPGAAFYADYIAWNTVVYEDPEVWDPGSPANVPILRPGLFLLTTGLEAAPVGGTIQLAIILLFAAGGFVGSARAPAGESFAALQFSTVMEMAEGDYVALYAFLWTDGTDWEVYPYNTNLTVTRIGPKRWT